VREPHVRFALALFLSGWLCSAGARAEPEPKGAKPDLQSLRAAFAKKPCKALAIVEPVEVKDVFYWKDGGSLGLELKDAKGTVHRFALDCRAKKAQHLFLGVTYPSETEGRRVDIWAAEEQELYAVLLRWVNGQPQRDAFLDDTRKLDDSTPPRLWEFAVFFARLDARFRQMNGLPPRGQ
jgi:hypothetical protein